MKTRTFYMVQVAGSEKWIECKARALKELQEYHGKERVKVDTHKGATIRIHYISIEQDP